MTLEHESTAITVEPLANKPEGFTMSRQRLTAPLARIFIAECQEWLADMHPRNPWRPAVALRLQSLNSLVLRLESERGACGQPKQFLVDGKDVTAGALAGGREPRRSLD